MLIGNVGKEPEIHFIDAGVASATLSLATNNPGYTLPNGTKVPERAEWHRVILWKRLAEIAQQYVHCGDKLYIEGQLHTRSYTDNQGKTRYITEIWADNMEMLSPKPQGGGKTSEEKKDTNKPMGTMQDNIEECPF